MSVVAPGGGTGANGSVYAQLGRLGFDVAVVGQSRAPYDRYPTGWPDGCPAPNLETFAQDLLDRQVLEQSDCLVFGSRGGQVVLPHLWAARGAAVPPAVVINGGCAMPGLPKPTRWPDHAVSFLLLGGEDYFSGGKAMEEYLAEVCGQVPRRNSTTAVLYVTEMGHMPQSQLLADVLPHMVQALVAWKATGCPPASKFDAVTGALARGSWSGRLLYTSGRGAWTASAFSTTGVQRL